MAIWHIFILPGSHALPKSAMAMHICSYLKAADAKLSMNLNSLAIAHKKRRSTPLQTREKPSSTKLILF